MARRAAFRILLLAGACSVFSAARAQAQHGGVLQLDVTDRDSGNPLPARMYLRDPRNRPVKAGKAPFWNDHFVFPGSLSLKLPKGTFNFEMERGPEYLTRTGHFVIDDFAEDEKAVDLKRFVDMSSEGWWSGDLDVERPAKDIELLMQAEDLHVAELIARSAQKSDAPSSKDKVKGAGAGHVIDGPLVRFDENRYYELASGTNAQGLLLLLNLKQPLSAADGRADFVRALTALREARQQGAWIDVEKPWAWDLPVWLAAGQVDSIELASSALCRKSVVDKDTPAARPRDKSRYAGPAGIGRWSEDIYYHLLNCGLRIPPTAGSGSGQVANPVGYNRVYVQVGQYFSYEKWWESLKAGRAVVTNGPLIRPTVEGQPPGYVFKAPAGAKIELEVGLRLSTRDPIDYLEVVQNGHVVHHARLDSFTRAKGKLPPVEFTESGWFLVRAVADVPGTYRFASSGPYYVEIGDRPRISKASAQFFLDWVDERIKKLEASNAREFKDVAETYQAARKFWEDLVSRANAE